MSAPDFAALVAQADEDAIHDTAPFTEEGDFIGELQEYFDSLWISRHDGDRDATMLLHLAELVAAANRYAAFLTKTVTAEEVAKLQEVGE